MRIAVVVAVSGALLFLACAGLAQDPAGFKPIATSKQLMEAFLIPASDVLFNVTGEPPKNDKEWKVVVNNALIVAESANLLMIGSRANDKNAWVKYSLALRDAAALAAKAAESKDVDGVGKAADEILTACSRCHDQFLPGAAEAR